MNPLRWIGQRRTHAIAAVVIIALFTPQIGLMLRPFVTHAVIGLLLVAFLRLDTSAAKFYLSRPRLIIATTLWTTLAVPVLFALTTKLLGFDSAMPDVFTGLMLQAMASPMMATPAIAAILGLDATLILITLICSTALTPLTAPLFAATLHLDLSLSPLDMGVKLLLILAACALGGLGLRRIITPERIAQHRASFDGLNILILFIFASAVMADVGSDFLTQPLFMLTLIVLTFAVSAVLLIVTYAVFSRLGRKSALALGIMSSQRNMGLMLAGVGGTIPEITWLYFAAAQFPMHFAPWILNRFARKQA